MYPKMANSKMEYSVFLAHKIFIMDTDYFLVCMSFYYRDDNWNDDESDSDFDYVHKHEEYSHSEIIHFSLLRKNSLRLNCDT
jgi:hypothetical protein